MVTIKAKGKQGFASMDKAKQREIAARGGYSAHKKGVAHVWNSVEATIAGRKGGKHKKKQSLSEGGEN